MNETKTHRYKVAICGIELASERRYTMEEVEDIHRLVENVAQIAVGDANRKNSAMLAEMVRRANVLSYRRERAERGRS